MNDELRKIIAGQDKLALDEYADARGVKLDRRKSFASMMQDFEAEQRKDEAMVKEKQENSEPDLSKLDAPGSDSEAQYQAQKAREAEAADEPKANVNEMADLARHRGDPAPAQAPAEIPLDDLDEMTRAWASTFAREIKEVTPIADGMTLKVRIVTRHGTSTESAEVEKWTKPEVKKALDEIKKKMA